MGNLVGESAVNRFHPEAAQAMEDAIRAAGGNEVFFAGKADAEGLVADVRVLARGNQGAVPALFEGLMLREVVVHNHPSGDIRPSDADLHLAAMYSAQGHGVYIVDNTVTHVYVVVEPFPDASKKALSAEKLDAILAPSGLLARALPDFEVRPQQREMMAAVVRAFNREELALIEAPTGVGKTFSYLLPAVFWAHENRERVVISTRTINLQEQILHKDLPLLERILNKPIRACLVKGRSNYVCLRKLERALSEATLFDDDHTRDQLQTLGAWAEESVDGSRSDLTFVPDREVWERVCSEADTCSMSRCPNPKKCFVGRARREMAKADLLIVNHHMLFSDLAIKQEAGDFSTMAVLPTYRRVILDEAHSVEDSATEYFGISASYFGFLATLSRLYRIDGRNLRGVVPTIRHKLVKDCPQVTRDIFDGLQSLCDEQVIPAVDNTRDLVAQAFLSLRILASKMANQIGREIKWRLTTEVLAHEAVRKLHQEKIIPAVEQARVLTQACGRLASALRKIEPTPDQVESPVLTELQQLIAYSARIERMAGALLESTSPDVARNTVRWVELDTRNEKIVRVARCPLEVGESLSSGVYPNLKTIVLASATLTVRQEFNYVEKRLGINAVEPGRVENLLLDTPFDFARQAQLYIQTDMPDPGSPQFQIATVETLRRVLPISRGNAFVLFTAFGALDHAYRELEAELRAQGLTPLKQGLATRTQLLDQFRNVPGSVLFATDSFWEGVDVAGSALQCVILPKLPFRVPSEPVMQARAEAIEASGGNAFMEYSVPQAVIKFRQGFGRLIRRKTDRGVVLVLDPRIVRKYYGKLFLESLPSLHMVRGSGAEIELAMREFFHSTREEPS
ncbi:MAG: DEAD/DEAH box helicase [Candidatus Hydrogenedentes bacterium]|nr:DEAD/DEAH box helicase [Candidatus Hydrogenedentota bacterium]